MQLKLDLQKTASYLVLWLMKIVGKDWSGHFLSGVAIWSPVASQGVNIIDVSVCTRMYECVCVCEGLGTACIFFLFVSVCHAPC